MKQIKPNQQVGNVSVQMRNIGCDSTDSKVTEKGYLIRGWYLQRALSAHRLGILDSRKS